jgi:DNA-binding NarL/FixJ family response regulator
MTAVEKPIRVAVAEDSLLMREGIVRVLGLSDEVVVVAECGDLPELNRAIADHSPDVVVTDVRMPPTNSDEGIQAAMELRRSNPTLGVVVLSQYAEPAYAAALLAEGSAGRAYLLKDGISQPGQLVAAVKAVAAGSSVVDPVIVEALVRDRRRHIPSPLSDLTEPERLVLDEIALGKSNAAISRALFLSERTVEKHINSLFGKLGLGVEPDINRRVMAVLLKLRSEGV